MFLRQKKIQTWSKIPRGLCREGRAHGSGFLFLIEKHRRLEVPLRMSGQHKLWRLDRRIANDAFKRLVPSEQTPANFAFYRNLPRTDGSVNMLTDVDEEPESCTFWSSDDGGNVTEDDEEFQEAIRLSMLEAQLETSTVESLAATVPVEPVPITVPAIDVPALLPFRSSAPSEDCGLVSTQAQAPRRGRWRNNA